MSWQVECDHGCQTAGENISQRVFNAVCGHTVRVKKRPIAHTRAGESTRSAAVNGSLAGTPGIEQGQTNSGTKR